MVQQLPAPAPRCIQPRSIRRRSPSTSPTAKWRLASSRRDPNDDDDDDDDDVDEDDEDDDDGDDDDDDDDDEGDELVFEKLCGFVRPDY